MVILDCTAEIGVLFCNLTTFYTGSFLISFVVVFFAFLLLNFIFGIPFDYSVVILLPLSILALIVTGNAVLLGLSLIYLAFIVARYLPF